MKIGRFEDIHAWREARELVQMVYAAIAANERFRKDFRLANQIQAASVSCMSNIAEGFSRHGRKEFIQFLYVAKGSAAETQSHLYVASDLGYVDRNMFDQIYDKADKVSRMASNLIKYLQAQTHTRA